MAATPVPDPLPPAISRTQQHVQAVLRQSLLEMGEDGRTALAWEWALTGHRPSPVTLSLPPGHPPTREEILAEAEADPEGSTAPPGVPTDFCDQIGEARRVMRWLIGDSDEIPADCEDRGRLIGARDDYARTEEEIRALRDIVLRQLHSLGSQPFTRPQAVAPGGSEHAWRSDPSAMDAVWLRGVHDLLDWILGDRPASPLTGQKITRPSAYDLSYEDGAAETVVMQGRPSGCQVDPARYPPQYGEAIHATIRWLRGETAVPIAPYKGSSGEDIIRAP